MNGLDAEQVCLISLVAAAVQGNRFKVPEQVNLNRLAALAERHQVTGLAYAAGKDTLGSSRPFFRTQSMKGAAKEATQQAALEQILGEFEKAGIRCMPLKGSVLKSLYPEPGLRTMADLDLLVPEEQMKLVRPIMLSLGYEPQLAGGNHDSYHRLPYMNVEVHRRLFSEDSPYHSYYTGVWDRARLKSGERLVYTMADEDLLVYVVAHMAKHFAGGGTGIRSFCDLWLLSRLPLARYEVWNSLRSLELDRFYAQMMRVCSAWFDGGVWDSEVDRISAFVLESGVFGTRRHAISSDMGKEFSVRSKLEVYLRLFFPGIGTMRILYPFLASVPVLLPFCWVHRGVDRLVRKKLYALKMIRDVQEVTADEAEDVSRMLAMVGLLESGKTQSAQK